MARAKKPSKDESEEEPEPEEEEEDEGLLVIDDEEGGEEEEPAAQPEAVGGAVNAAERRKLRAEYRKLTASTKGTLAQLTAHAALHPSRCGAQTSGRSCCCPTASCCTGSRRLTR